MTRRSFAAGDGLRALAVLAVLLFHAAVGALAASGELDAARGTIDWTALPAGNVLRNLDTGVYLFLVLSGYLVGGPFVRAWLEGRPGPPVARYLWRRAKRLAPAFWLVALLSLLAFGAVGSSWREIAALLAFGQIYDPSPFSVSRFAHGWTVDLEVTFYLAVPLVVAALRWVPQASRPAVLWAGLAGATLLSWRLQATEAGTLGASWAVSLPGLLFGFTPGLALAALEPRLAPRLAGSVAGRRAAVGLLALGVASFAGLLLCDETAFGLRAIFHTGAGGGLVGAALVWEWTTGRTAAGLDRPVPVALGRWSYGIYLIHLPVSVEVWQRVAGDDVSASAALAAVAALTAAITIPLAALSWWLVEQPILDGRRPRRPGGLRRRSPEPLPQS